MKLKSYNIIIEDHSYKKIFYRKTNEIQYIDNSQKTIKDLKNFICEICDFCICPCKIKFPRKSSNNYYNKYHNFYSDNDINYKDNDLLSSIISFDNLVVYVMLENTCICSEEYKNYYRYSKDSIVDLLIKSNGKKNELENTIKKLKEEIKESKLKFEENENKSYTKYTNINDLKNNKMKLIEKTNEYKNKIDVLNNNISDLNINIKKQNNSIKELEDKEKRAKITIGNLENDLEIKKQTLQKVYDENKSHKNELKKIKSENYSLVNQNKAKENTINNLKEEMLKLEDTNKNLIKQNKHLSLMLEENPDTLKRIHDLGYCENIKASDNSTKIDTETNKIQPTFNKKEFKNFYDTVIEVTSVKDISEGWKIEMDEAGEKAINEFKDKDVLRIGIIGNSNKGKSFILSRISKIDLASGYYINTKGLSIKYPVLKDHSNRNIVLLDSAGLETPVLNNNIYDEANIVEKGKKDNGNINMKEEEKSKDDIIINGNSSTIKNMNDNKNENNNENDKKRNIFMEKSKEKLITELFLQKYIILNSDILILVVGILTYSEQKLINKILDEIKNLNVNKKIIIIHNLKELFTIEQVENYIQNTLLKSVTFELVERKIINSKYTSKDNKEYGRYFVEKNDDNNKNNPDIFHLIFANEDSEAGKYYNRFALEFIESSYINISNIKPFDIIKTIKERFKEHSKDFIENDNKSEVNIEMNDDEDIIKNKIIRLKNQQEITLKRCLIDEFGLWNLKKNGFEPKYSCFKKDDKLIVKIEVPGRCSILPSLSKKGALTIIKIKGEKLTEEQGEQKQFFNTRVFGKFNFEIILNEVDIEIRNTKPNRVAKNGVVTLEYEIEGKVEESEFKVDYD